MSCRFRALAPAGMQQCSTAELVGKNARQASDGQIVDWPALAARLPPALPPPSAAAHPADLLCMRQRTPQILRLHGCWPPTSYLARHLLLACPPTWSACTSPRTEPFSRTYACPPTSCPQPAAHTTHPPFAHPPALAPGHPAARMLCCAAAGPWCTEGAGPTPPSTPAAAQMCSITAREGGWGASRAAQRIGSRHTPFWLPAQPTKLRCPCPLLQLQVAAAGQPDTNH